MSVKEQGFYINGQPYRFAGVNMWYAVLLAAGNKNDRQRLVKELDFLKQNGVNNIRVLIGSQDGTKMISGVMPVHPAMQTAKNNFSETILKGMDFLLQQLEQRRMYAVFYFANNWEWSGGFLQYLNWNNKIADTTLAKKLGWDDYRDLVAPFYTCTECMDDYFAFVKKVLHRTSTITSKKYSASTAVMAWEIANEPRPMRPYAIPAYLDFIKNAAAQIRSLDKNHLVTAGVEGFNGTENLTVFAQLHRDSNISYATIHIWPKNWGWYKDSTFENDFTAVLQKTKDYIAVHDSVMLQIKKPLVVEEFGLPRDGFLFSPGSPTQYRNRYIEMMLQQLATKKQTALAGINCWAFGGYGKPAANETPFWKVGDDLLGDPPMEEQGLNTVFAADSSTWKIIRKFTAGLNKAK
ncbi:MAG: cellulase family glycosylhydrolase [Ferruginibacter sp.]